ncbi:hypothetical protein Leryth_006389 [Lithospermum erythrorhizon]|nr:hypothetical protein Leryth_006389 [Lithospermum erythrorhizon]
MEIIRGQENFQEPVSRLPVLPRLDCLDRLTKTWGTEGDASTPQISGKTSLYKHNLLHTYAENSRFFICVLHFYMMKILASSSLFVDNAQLLLQKEFHQKGTLMERLTMLENRVIQLSLDMDEGYNSSKNVLTPNKLGHDSVWSTTTTEGDEDKIARGVESDRTHKSDRPVCEEGEKKQKFQENVWVV